MKENFLHFVWQYQYFDKKELISDTGESIQIISTGRHNNDAGPDFLNSKIQIGKVTWYGNIEIHINSSDWFIHKHQNDSAYENVILHVVWKNDQPVYRKDGTTIPCIELKDRINTTIFSRYSALIVSKDTNLACAGHMRNIPEVLKTSMLEKALLTRLEKKTQKIQSMQDKNFLDWEETSYKLLLRNFGFKLNAAPFSRLALVLPFKIIKKHKANLLQIESLLFGQAGMLNKEFTDPYCKNLKEEFEFLSHKYSLEEKVDPSEWKFLRLRPANFPTIRLAQLATVLSNTESLFNQLTENCSLKDLIYLFQKNPSEYWLNHYSLDKKSKQKNKGLGLDSIHNIIINTVVPLLAAAGNAIEKIELKEKALNILESLPPENNRITRMWNTTDLKINNAAEAQGSIELFNSYCSNKLCLNCNIGVAVIKDL